MVQRDYTIKMMSICEMCRKEFKAPDLNSYSKKELDKFLEKQSVIKTT